MKDLLKIFRSLSDETRLRMVGLLTNRECCVCEVMDVLGISQTRASRNLQVLYAAGLLNRRKAGLWAYYSLNRSGLGKRLLPLIDALGEALASDRQIKADGRALAVSTRADMECCR